MQQVDTTDVILPIGYVDSAGNWFDRVTIREFLGKDNQAMSSPEARNNGTRGVSQLLSNVVKRIYNSKETSLSINKPTLDHVRDMFIGDRDQLLIDLRKLSMGNEVPIKYKCPGCDTMVNFNLPLDDDNLKTRRADSFPPNLKYTVELKRGFQSLDGQTHTTVVMSHLRGYQAEQLTNVAKADPAKAAMMAIYQSIVEVPGLPKEQLTQNLIFNAKKVDLDILGKATADNRLGPDLQPETICGMCDTETSIPLGLGTLFRTE